jgi:hypothetical protein
MGFYALISSIKHYTECLVSAINPIQGQIKEHPIGEEQVNLLFPEDIIIYVESTDMNKKILEQITYKVKQNVL